MRPVDRMGTRGRFWPILRLDDGGLVRRVDGFAGAGGLAGLAPAQYRGDARVPPDESPLSLDDPRGSPGGLPRLWPAAGLGVLLLAEAGPSCRGLPLRGPDPLRAAEIGAGAVHGGGRGAGDRGRSWGPVSDRGPVRPTPLADPREPAVVARVGAGLRRPVVLPGNAGGTSSPGRFAAGRPGCAECLADRARYRPRRSPERPRLRARHHPSARAAGAAGGCLRGGPIGGPLDPPFSRQPVHGTLAARVARRRRPPARRHIS